MKKQLFAAALVIAAISFTGCKTEGGSQGGDGKITAISVSPKEILLNENVRSAKLGVKLTPSDAKATVEWSSSDTTVATVTNKGFVEAVFFGDCYIYAKAGDFKDSCKVKVTTYYESLIFTGAFLSKVDTTFALDTITGKYRVDTVQASSGETYYCYPSMATLELFSDGLYVNNSGYLDGAASGTIIEIQAPMYYGTEYLNGKGKGVLFSLGAWAVTDTARYSHQGYPGEVDEVLYIQSMKAFIDGLNAGDQSAYITALKAASLAFEAPYIDTYTYDSSDPDNPGYTHPYIPNGICTEALVNVVRDYPASEYMYGLSYSNVTFELLAMDTVFGDYFGLNLAYDVETEIISMVDDKVYYEDPITVTYGEKPTESKAMEPIKNPFILSEHPEMEARILDAIKEKAIVLRRNK